jgi:hypothetical protein
VKPLGERDFPRHAEGMHMLAEHYRSEFLACPQLARLDYAEGQDGLEPTLLVKGSTLLLKYIVSGARIELAFLELHDRLLYGVWVFDDPAHPAFLWSVLESDKEKQAVEALMRGEQCQIFIFNEIAVNVAWAAASVGEVTPGLLEAIRSTSLGQADHAAIGAEASRAVKSLRDGPSEHSFTMNLEQVAEWHPITSHFITSHASASLISLFDADEGNQQEQIGVWLTDNLHPGGVHHSPQIPKGAVFRELIDILLSYEFGSILIESKALAIYTRSRLPDREKLSHAVTGHITKAANQLRGGIRRLKDGTPVFSKSGILLDIERSQPMHGIILIPDMDLVQDAEAYGPLFIESFMEATGGFIHILDPSELLRMVQAAEMIVAQGQTTTRMMAFDYYLIERAKKTMEAGTLCIEVLLRIVDESSRRAGIPKG